MTEIVYPITKPFVKNHPSRQHRRINSFNLFQHLVDHFPDILYRYRVQPNREFEYINSAIVNLTGHVPEDYIKNPDLIFCQVHPDDKSLLEDCLVNFNCSNATNIRWLGKDGQVTWTEHRSIPVTNNHGDIIAIEGIIRDVTQQKQAILAEMKTKNAVVSHLISLGKAVNLPASLHELAEKIGLAIQDLCNADAGILVKYSAKNQGHCLWSKGLDDDHISQIMQQVFRTLQENPTDHPQTVLLKNHFYGNDHFHSVILCPLIFEHSMIGGLACFSYNPKSWNEQVVNAIEAFSSQAAIALQNIQLSRELHESYLQAILALTKTMKVRDMYTSEHSNELVGWAETLAWKLGFRSPDLESIRWAALLHDIGKIGIPDVVLRKPSRLNDEEWKVMKQHSQIGADIVGGIHQMTKVSRLIKYHHEHFDGSGYPEGLTGDQIPLGARILAVVDAYSAMTANRVYQPARPPQEACEELQRTAGTQFDPQVVNLFLQMMKPSCVVSEAIASN